MTEVAKLSVSIIADSRGLQTGLRDAERQVNATDQRVSGSASRMGGALQAGFAVGAAAAVEFGRRAFNSAAQFETSMANVRAVTGATRDEMAGLSREVLSIGAGSVPGVQATASAFFDISSAVSDASARMEILQASVALAESGQADLAVASGATVRAFNAYGFGVRDIGNITDVYTRTVATGIGTLDQFSAAISQNAGLAASARVEFDELGAATAFITSRGQTTGAAGTQIRAIISNLLTPSRDLQRVYNDLGIESITAAIESEGFVNVLNDLTSAAGGSEQQLAAMFTSVEALQGIMALGSEDATTFLDNYRSGLEGATEAARAAQLDTFSAQWAMLSSNIEGASVAAVNSGGILGGLTDAMSGLNTFIDVVSTPAAAAPEIDAASFFQDVESTLTVSYTVQAGDTASEIAAELGTTTDNVIAALPEGVTTTTMPIGLVLEIEIDDGAALQDVEYAFRNMEREISNSAETTVPKFDTMTVSMEALRQTVLEFTGLDLPFHSWGAGISDLGTKIPLLNEFIGVLDELAIALNPLLLAAEVTANTGNLINAASGALDGGQSGDDTRSQFMSIMGFSDAQRGLYGGLVAPAGEAQTPGFGQGFNPNFYGAGPSMLGGEGGGVEASVSAESLETMREDLENVAANPIFVAAQIAEEARAQMTADVDAAIPDVVPVQVPLHIYNEGRAESFAEQQASGAIPGRASGGPVAAGGAYMVGENGPEMLLMGNQSGRVVPNSALGGGQPQVIQLVVDGRTLAEVTNSRNDQMMQ